MPAADRDERADRSRETSARLFRRWFPTGLGTAMLVAELPLVTMSAARSAEPGATLAALGIAMSLLVIINAPALALAGLVVVAREAGDARLRLYAVLVGVVGAVLIGALAGLPALLAALRWLLDLDESITTAVRWCLIGLIPNPVGVALRRYLHGRLIRAQRTRPIAWATLVRIVASAALAWLAVSLFPSHGPLAAGLALSFGALAEFVLLALVVRRMPAAPRQVPAPRLVRRHVQLTSAWLLNTTPAMVTTIGIAHASEPIASLVVWPVTYQLALLFSSPLADWDTVTAETLRTNGRRRPVWILTLWLVAGFGGLFAAVVVTGLDSLYVNQLNAVPTAPAALGLTWLPLLLPMPALWALRGALRGVVMAGRRRGWLVAASAAHLLTLAVTAGTLGLTTLPGVAAGALAVVAGLTAEVLVLSVTCVRRGSSGACQGVSRTTRVSR